MDLKQLFGHRYVVTLDVSWKAETPANRLDFIAKGECWWYYEIIGAYGTVWPFSRSQFVARLTRRIGKKAMETLAGEYTIVEDSLEAISLRSDIQHLALILKLIKPKRRSQLTPEQREVLGARLAANRYRKPKKITENDTSNALRGAISITPLLPDAGADASV